MATQSSTREKVGGFGLVLIVVALVMVLVGYSQGKPHFTVATTDGSGVSVAFGVHMTDCNRDRNFNDFPNRDCAAAWDKRIGDSHSTYEGAAVALTVGLLLMILAIRGWSKPVSAISTGV